MRKKNSLYNVLTIIAYYGFSIVFNFLLQAVIIRVMGIEYTGINGLFVNVLNLLSIADLGIGTAIIYKLYKPIAEKNEMEISKWMNFYKKCYNYIAIIILIIGLCLTPFITHIVGVNSIQENIYVLYLLCFSTIVVSYFMAYKKSFIFASQKNYFLTLTNTLYLVLLNIMQIAILILTKNYIYFLLIKLVLQIVYNICIGIYVDRKYPFIKINNEKLSKNEIDNIFSRVKSIFFEKISYVVNKGIDNVIISLKYGISMVGYYTNYYIISAAIINLILNIFKSFTASIGNMLVEKNLKKNFKVYKELFFVNSFLVGLFIVGFINVIDPFITIWVGKKYILDSLILYSFALYIYTDGMRYTIMIFREAAGICFEDRYMYLISVIINLLLSITLPHFIGISGIVIGTTASYLFLLLYSYPKYSFKKIFKVQTKIYYFVLFKYSVQIFIACCVSMIICKNVIIDNNYLLILIKGLIAEIIYFITFIIFFKKSDEYKNIIEFVKKIMRRKNNEKN